MFPRSTQKHGSNGTRMADRVAHLIPAAFFLENHVTLTASRQLSSAHERASLGKTAIWSWNRTPIISTASILLLCFHGSFTCFICRKPACLAEWLRNNFHTNTFILKSVNNGTKLIRLYFSLVFFLFTCVFIFIFLFLSTTFPCYTICRLM